MLYSIQFNSINYAIKVHVSDWLTQLNKLHSPYHTLYSIWKLK